MRDLSGFEALPSRAQLREAIPRPERFRPEARILQKATITPREDGFADLALPGLPPRRVHPMVAEAHRAMEDGCTFDEVVARAAPLWQQGRRPKLVATLLRSYYLTLAERGFLQIPFEAPPARFAGRFELVRTIGRGGMGVVHLCRDLESGASVVVKHAWGWSVPIERAERTTRREALALAQLDHPLVPGLVATFEEEGLLHLARAFAPGRPLLGSGARSLQADAGRRLLVARDACEAIHHVHERGMLYLDAKPDNFILGEDGRARLVDLGLCRPAQEGGLPLRAPLGSRGYAAPEVVRARRASERSDVYGAGRLLFYLATGARPRTKHDGATLRALMREKGAPEADLVAWMAAEDPADRPASLALVLARLDELLASMERAPDVVAA